MSRLFAPTFGVLLLAALIGCGGGGGSPSFGEDPDTSGTSTSGTSGNTNGSTVQPAIGTYAIAFDGTAGATTYTGSGTATAASGGVVAINVPAGSSSDTLGRTANVTISQSGGVTGTMRVGTSPATTITSGSVTQQSAGIYLLTTTFTNPLAVQETDRFSLTLGASVYKGPVTGTDDKGGTYSGNATGLLTTGNVVSLTYSSTRTQGTSATHTQRSVFTLQSNGTFSGTLDLTSQTVPATGTWTLNGTVLTLTLNYQNINFLSGSPLTSPNTTETLTLTKQ